MLMDQIKPRVIPFSPDNAAIVKNVDLCSECGHCYSVCQEEIGVGARYHFQPGEEYKCIGCGQCTAACPEEAITGRPHYKIVKELIKDPDKIVYFVMHEETTDLGAVKPKTIGKLLDEKVCIEGLFTIVLRAEKDGDRPLPAILSLFGARGKGRSPRAVFISPRRASIMSENFTKNTVSTVDNNPFLK